jgi:hypothetical protein
MQQTVINIDTVIAIPIVVAILMLMYMYISGNCEVFDCSGIDGNTLAEDVDKIILTVDGNGVDIIL